MWKIASKYALVCGIFLNTIVVLSLGLGSHPFVDFRHILIDLFLFSLFIIFACREFKKYQNDGKLHFWQGMTLSFFTYLPAVLLYGMGLLIWMNFDSHFLENYKNEATQFLHSNYALFSSETSPETFSKKIQALENSTAIQVVIAAILKKIILGFFVSPIVSVILRKK